MCVTEVGKGHLRGLSSAVRLDSSAVFRLAVLSSLSAEHDSTHSKLKSGFLLKVRHTHNPLHICYVLTRENLSSCFMKSFF